MAYTSEIRAITIRLRHPGFDIEPDRAWEILGRVAEEHPELDQYSTSEEDARFKISRINAKKDELANVAISRDKLAIAVAETMNFGEWQKYSTGIFAILSKEIRISPLSIIHVDNQYHRSWKTDVHHGQMLYDIFGGPPPFKAAFGNSAIVQYAPNAMFVLDAQEQIICSLIFQSSSTVAIDIQPQYPEPYELSGICGIAKIGNYKPNTKIEDVLSRVYEYSGKYQDACLRDHIFAAVEAYIGEKGGVVEEGN
ncbi:MAG: hypothetical protein KJ970_04925 [Candidatus Eisenbacteria bacterium]|uniref:Uncharacterized protein n=1 Tax=Eiseniibacteriota bacterium TaxID=2212470 RepID=A0A948W645_UNCEI|nr:hypothetical protein [Candidatus Eisenbacteria bacterium]MBU1947334.1 hypothetical protein [Candidatus Eisenbacteria bacterium]MBU2690251.1 hypothetical protein [Candidatus Eisenbacteria bacterium]